MRDKIVELREQLRFDERPIFVERFLDDCELYADWEQINSCLEDLYSFNCMYINKTKTEHEDAGAIKLFNFVETNESYNFKKVLQEQKTIIITNFEKKNGNVRRLIHEFMDNFYIELDNYGVWPMQYGGKAGAAHLYCGGEESNSFPPHCDLPHNFIFQIEGESEFTTYENKAFGLGDVGIPYNYTEEQKKEVYNNLRVIEKRVMKPGDMVYVPSRQFHHVKPLSNRISISLPFVLKGPLAS